MQENKPKVLIGIPYHKAKNYCLKHLLERVQELTYENKDVVMRFDLAEYGGQDNVKKQREFMRKVALDGDYDYLYFMGVDTIPPKDVIERLLRHYESNPAVIVGGVYWGRHDAHNGRPEGAVAWIHNMSQEEQTKTFSTMNRLLKVDGMGMDAVLIPRSALEKISFMSWEQNDDDYPFYDLATKEHGFKILIDTNIQCKHYFDKDGYTYLAKAFKK